MTNIFVLNFTLKIALGICISFIQFAKINIFQILARYLIIIGNCFWLITIEFSNKALNLLNLILSYFPNQIIFCCVVFNIQKLLFSRMLKHIPLFDLLDKSLSVDFKQCAFLELQLTQLPSVTQNPSHLELSPL